KNAKRCLESTLVVRSARKVQPTEAPSGKRAKQTRCPQASRRCVRHAPSRDTSQVARLVAPETVARTPDPPGSPASPPRRVLRPSLSACSQLERWGRQSRERPGAGSTAGSSGAKAAQGQIDRLFLTAVAPYVQIHPEERTCYYLRVVKLFLFDMPTH